MTDTKPKLNLDGIMDRAIAATEPPWVFWDRRGNDACGCEGVCTGDPREPWPDRCPNLAKESRPSAQGVCIGGRNVTLTEAPDSEFIAHARTDIPAMVRWMRRALGGLRRVAHASCPVAQSALAGCGECPTCQAAKAAQALLDQIEP